jgi:hypothetical protein
MRIFKTFFVPACLGLLLAAGIHGQNPSQKTIEAEDPILRIDLLQTLDRELKAPKRNIFSPEKASVQSPQSIVQGVDPVTGATDSLAEQGSEGVEAARVSINLSYKGFVRAGDRFVALVMYEGMSMAVLQGDFIAEGVEIGTINVEEIEVIAASSPPQKFPIEGEQE